MRIALCLLLLPCLATADDTPAPVLEYTFDEGVPEGAEVVDYALGEGLVLLPGPWRDCLDLTAASRFGGTLEQTDPAGGALFVRDEQIDNLTDFTVTFWAMGQGADEAINARLLNRMGSWELIYAYGRFGALLVNGDRKTNHAVPPATNPNEWAFHAVTLDVGALKLATYTGDAAGGLAASREYDIPEPPDNTAGELQIGTFGGVRPFRGKLDNLRIFGSALSPEQVAGVFDADVAAQGAGWVYSTGMPAMPARPFMLKPSDIVLSSRWQTRKKAEAFDLIRACHVDHLLWVYGNDPAYIREAKALGVTYQGTLNGLAGWDRATPDLSAEGDTTGRQQDFDGNKVVLGHMRKWTPEHPRWTGNHNSDAFRAIFFEECDRLIEAGIDSLHIDDWEMAASTVSYGISGFSPESLANFTQYLDDNVSAEGLAALGIADLGDFDYREYLRNEHGIASQEEYLKAFRDLPTTPLFIDAQRAGLRDFYAALRTHLDATSPDRYIPVSVNNQFYRAARDGGLRGVYCLDRLDFFEGEAMRGMQSAPQYVMACKTAEALGVPQVMMSKPHVLGHSEAALATSYALGAPFRVPWDLYMDNGPDGQPAPRYFGELETWRPYYDFIEARSDLLDGHAPVAEVALVFNADEPCHEALNEACGQLLSRGVQFTLIGAASRFSRVALSSERIESARHAILLSPEESFAPEDRAALADARASRRVRVIDGSNGLSQAVEQLAPSVVRIEGPESVHAFLTVESGDDASAVVHVVNWNAFPSTDVPADATRSEAYADVTISLRDPGRWGDPETVTYHQPDGESTILTPEHHPNALRVTLPRLATWGILEIRPTKE